jgi:hypothetical protein
VVVQKKKQEENIQKFRLLPVFQKFLISFLTFRRKNTVYDTFLFGDGEKDIYTPFAGKLLQSFLML